MIRIISGQWKGRKLLAPPGLATRPLTDRIKQSLFDWLGQTLDEQIVVDTCAGSGSFAFEAASRGAKQVHACEIGRDAIPTILANHKTLGSPSSITIHAVGFEIILPKITNADLIFCDPPFPWFTEEPQHLVQLLTLAAASLAADGRIILRGEQGVRAPIVQGLREVERREYGRSWVIDLRKSVPITVDK